MLDKAIESAAHAIAALSDCNDGRMCRAASCPCRILAKDAVLAAMLAIRHPSDEMLAVGRRGLDGNTPYDRDAELVWRDMFDKLLEGY